MRDAFAGRGVHQPSLEILDAGDQQVTAARVPRQAVRLRPDRDLTLELAGGRIEDQDLARAPGRGKHEGSAVVLRAQHAAAFGAALNAARVRQVVAVQHVDGVVRGVGDDHPASGQVHVAMVEAAGRVRWQVDRAAEDQHHPARLDVPSWAWHQA